MVIDFIRESLDGLTDAEKQHYKQTDKGFVLEVNDSGDDRVKGLVENRNQALAEKDRLQSQLKAFDGLDPKVIKEREKRIEKLEADLEDARKASGTSTERIEKIKADLQAEYNQKLQERDNQIQAFEKQVLDDAKRGEISKALRESGVREKAVDMAAVFLQSRVVAVKGDTGTPTVRVLKGDGSGDYEVSTRDGSVFKTVPELVEEMKNDANFSFLFEGSKASGGGADAKQTGPGGNVGFGGQFAHVLARSDLRNDKERSDFIKYLKEVKYKGDGVAAQQAYMALPAVRPG